MYFVGIDIGTTNSKICLYRDQDFNCLQKYIFPTPKISNGKYIEFDINTLWENIKLTLKQILSQNINIGNICIASVGESGVLIDKEGNIKGPSIVWYDTRTAEQVRHVANRIGFERLYEITGLPAHSNYSINKILWIFENCGIEKKQNLKWLSIASYIAYKLSGTVSIDFSLASRTMLLNLENKTWSKEILNDLNINANLMPNIVESGEPIGNLRKDIINELGFYDNITVSIGGHDHMCGAIATGIFNSSELLDSTGTSEGLLMIRDKPCLEKDYLNKFLSNGIYTLKNYFTLFGSLPSAGSSFEWMRKIFFDEKNDYNKIFERIKKVSSDNMVYIPHLVGSGPPKRYVTSNGIIYGLRDTSTKFQIGKAILEGVCFELKLLYETMLSDSENKPDSIKVIGAASKNPVWLQLKADILGCKIEAYEVDEAVARGAAMLGAYKCNKINLSDIAEMNKDKITCFNPCKEMNHYYNDKFMKTFKPIYDVSINMKN